MRKTTSTQTSKAAIAVTATMIAKKDSENQIGGQLEKENETSQHYCQNIWVNFAKRIQCITQLH